MWHVAVWLFPWRSYQCRCSMRSRFYSLNDYIVDFNIIWIFHESISILESAAWFLPFGYAKIIIPQCIFVLNKHIINTRVSKVKSSSHHIEVMCKYIWGCMHAVGWIRSGWELFFITRNHRLHKLLNNLVLPRDVKLCRVLFKLAEDFQKQHACY